MDDDIEFADEEEDEYHKPRKKSVGFKTDVEVHWDPIHDCPTLPISELRGSKFTRAAVNHEPILFEEDETFSFSSDHEVIDKSEPDSYFVIVNNVVYRCKTRKLHRKHQNCYMDSVLHELSEGCSLHKIKGGGVLYTRDYFLDTKTMKLLYTGSQRRFRKKNTSWPLSSVEEVREGEKDYAKRLDQHDKYKVFCVVFGANHEVLYLMAHNYELRDKWIKGLRYAIQMDQYLKQKENSNVWIRQAFDRADKNQDNNLDFEEIMKLLKTLNADMDRNYVKELFNAADVRKMQGQKPTLDREEFVAFYNKLTERKEIEDIFLKYSRDLGYMTASDLQRFLIHDQKEGDVSIEKCKEIILVYEPQPEFKRTERMSLIGFRSFLVSHQQHLFNRAHRRVYQDMTQPMTNYFINSSHNTYLAEDQLKGPSRVECYISALKRGCRCVELDCWDGNDDEPVIYHGYTLTSKILFGDVIKAIKDYAFITSPYPVCLSIENHCSVPQQTKMAQIMVETFKVVYHFFVKMFSKLSAEELLYVGEDMLYCPDGLVDSPPSPHELKNKIIVKGKKLPVSATENNGEVSDEDEAAEASNNLEKQKKKSNLKLSVELSNCVAMKSVHFGGTDTIPKAPENFRVVSLAEKKIGKLADSELENVCSYTKSMLVRTYPAGTRTDSSNYSPVPMWCGGCQIVALNFQTGGEEMQLLHGRFLDNGNSGYVLKPPCLRTGNNFDSIVGSQRSPTRKQITIKIISAFQLPKPKDSQKGEIIDPFLKIEIHGVQRDCQSKKTAVIKNNGFNPIWNEEMTFNVDVPELALLRVSLMDHDTYVDDFIGYYVVPFNSIVQGYRHMTLFDRNGDQFEQGLVFVHITVQDQPAE